MSLVTRRAELWGWAATALAIAGVWLNNHRLWPCFVLWIASNAISLALHLRLRAWSLAGRDLAFVALALHGLWLWRIVP